MWRTVNSDIVTQSNALSNQLSTHDASIKSLLNTFKFVKSIQRGTIDRDIEINGGKTYSINISDVDPNKSIVLFDVSWDSKYFIYQLLRNSILISNLDTKYIERIYALTYQVIEFY